MGTFLNNLAVAIKREYVTLRMNASVYICCVIAFKREECACRTAFSKIRFAHFVVVSRLRFTVSPSPA